MANLKSIIIFVSIGIVLILLYVFFIKGDPEIENLVYTDPLTTTSGEVGTTPDLSSDFLFLLLNIKNIKLDDTIFADEAFVNLRDSSITLYPGWLRRPAEPFAPIGVDIGNTPAAPILSTELEPSNPNPILPPANSAPTTPKPATSTPPPSSSSSPVNPFVL